MPTDAFPSFESAVAASLSYVESVKAASEQVLATTQKSLELGTDLAKNLIDLTVEHAPTFRPSVEIPGKDDVMAAGFAPLEIALSVQRAAVTSFLDATSSHLR